MLVIRIEHPLAFGFGLLGNILSFMVFLAPLPTFYRVYKKKSTESFHSLPYIVALFSAMLWLYYAILTEDVLLLTINGTACVFESIYLAIFIVYAPRDALVFALKLISILNILLYGCLVVCTLIFFKGRKRIEIMGSICASLAVCVFVAPLSVIKRVIRTKSVEYMPFSLSLFLTLSAIAWFCYGLLRKDTFVAVPNVLGFIFGMVQMVLYFIYKSPRNGESTSQVVDIEKYQTTNGSTVVEIEITTDSVEADKKPGV
ncbi:Bidirectional sugar transporter SWEET [Rhynchospora pubera]|uniref:Bidirectional sugar transporter SWEET n=1 Tax=Rhynchospora pubera TaxID=906938 RepID=A0AAV8HI27_9POAL|nr:Bidirectional sugar transporter SWEET [Rhynchospora pubera]